LFLLTGNDHVDEQNNHSLLAHSSHLAFLHHFPSQLSRVYPRAGAAIRESQTCAVSSMRPVLLRHISAASDRSVMAEMLPRRRDGFAAQTGSFRLRQA